MCTSALRFDGLAGLAPALDEGEGSFVVEYVDTCSDYHAQRLTGDVYREGRLSNVVCGIELGPASPSTCGVLTFCSGLMAVAFWTLRGDFDPAWWAPNLFFLLIYPLFFLPRFLKAEQGP